MAVKTEMRAMNQLRAQINEYKLRKGCKICGYRKHPQALQLAHRDATTKYRTASGRVVEPSDMIKGKNRSRYGEATVWQEVNKCDVLCANCHAELTHS